MAFLDFDDLIRSCRSDNARDYIKEALDCYRIGAIRSCIIATWIALVYDVIDKLRELSFSGDAAAKKKVEEFEDIHKKRDTVAALKFEREILDIMKNEFDLITAHEASDLGRLLEDRNRCGHPNLNRDADAYVPVPELARLHLRNVVEHVLQRPPVQGKAAIDQLHKVVDSDYFPTDQIAGEKVLEGTALARIKPNVAADFAMGAVSSILREDLPLNKCRRRLVAAVAARRKHPEIVEKAFSSKFDPMLSKTTDTFLNKAVWLLNAEPDFQRYVQESNWTRLKTFISALIVKDMPRTVARALKIPALHEAAATRVATSTDKELEAMIKTDGSAVTDESLITRAIDLYIASGSWDTANFIAKNAVVPLIPRMSLEQRKKVLSAVSNTEVSGSFAFRDVLIALRDSHSSAMTPLKTLFVEAHIPSSFDDVIEPKPIDDTDVPF